jgi:hypothetical protein
MNDIFNIPVEPKYDFMFTLESENDFNKAERTIYDSLVFYSDMNGSKWCSCLTNDVNFACEVPSVDRLIKITEIQIILPYLPLIQAEPQRLEEFKSEMILKPIGEDWKWLISKLQIVNRNDYEAM